MPDPKEKKPSIFDNIDYSKVIGNIVKDIPVYEPSQYSGKLDLRSSTLENGVPAAILGDNNSEEYLAELKAQRQGLLDKFANGTLQAANTAVVGTIGNTMGVIHGLADLANNKSFFDNPTFKFMDQWDESVKEAIPLYRSKLEQTGSVSDRVLDKDFLFGDIFQGVGFVASSLIPGAGWTKAGKLARTALLANRINKLDQLVLKGAVTIEEFNKLNNFIKTTDNVIAGVSNLSAATMGRMYESRLEAKDVYDSTYNNSYEKKLQELLSVGITNEEAVIGADNYAQKQATDARNFSFGANMLLAIPDYYQMSKIFSNIGNKINTVNKIATNTATEVLKSTPKNLLGKTAKVFSSDAVKIASTEALEEGTQYNISETSKKLAEKDYDFNVSNFVNEFINQSVKNIASPEFLTSALAGAVIGGGMSLLGSSKNTDNPIIKNAVQEASGENTELIKKTEQAKDNISKFVDLEQKKTKLAETITDKNTPEETKIKAEVTSRQIDNLQFAQSVKSNLESGNLDNYLMEIESYGNSTKEQISNNFGVTSFEYETNGKEISPKEIAEKKINRAKKQAAIYQNIQSNYNNLSQISKDELYNNMITTEYNSEKLNLVSNKINQLDLEKSNNELLKIPFPADKQSLLESLNKEKNILVDSQKELGDRFLEIKNNKAEERALKIPKIETKVEKPIVVETPIDVVKSSPDSKFKGSEIEILEKNNYKSGNRITFKVKGSSSKISLSEVDFNKQVLGTTSDSKNTTDTKTNFIKFENNDVDDLPIDTGNDDIAEIKIEKEKLPITNSLSKDRKELGTTSFFNSPLFFASNTTTENRNSLLFKSDWKDRFRVVLNRKWAKDKSIASKAYNNEGVFTYTNGGPNALDITVEYNDIQEDGSNRWMPYGSLPYSGMLRDNKGNPYDFSLMSYEDFIDKFYVTKILDANSVEQTVEFTKNQFDILKIQQGIFKEFEILAKQLYNNSSEEELVLPDSIATSRLVYFVYTGEIAMNELSNLQGFENSKLLTISDGKINKDLTTTDKRVPIPDYLTETFGTTNKTFVNVELENGINFWTVAFTKGNTKKLENIVSDKLTEIAVNYNSITVNPENDLTVNNIIRDINNIIFINNNLENYINFRSFPLDSKKGYKLTMQYKTDTGSKYIDIFNPENTVKQDGNKLSIEELKNHFSFDNLSNLINDGFNSQGIAVNINSNSFVSNTIKGNPKLEDVSLPIKGIDLNIKFDYNVKELPTLISSTALDKSTNNTVDEEVQKETNEQLAKLQSKKKTKFSKLLEERNQNEVNFILKSVDILQSNKAKQVFEKGNKAKWDLNKILTELQVPKEQKQLILNLNINDREQLALELVSKYSYSVEINTAKEKIQKDQSYLQPWERDETTLQTVERNAQHYSNLTVPGGTNYTEQEISTPLIIPNIKGHAQFSTDNGIGWFRSDDRQRVKGISIYTKEEADRDLRDGKISQFEYDMASESFGTESLTETDTKTRRILEVQSDLFQKGRDKEILAEDQWVGNTENGPIIEEKKNENQFLQLLNKDSNWVTFFVKSIIQDSAKKGYEKVLFPSGNTASKVEGHTTLEEFKKQKEDRIKELETIKSKGFEEMLEWEFTPTSIDIKINQLKQELERVETEGFGALKPIWNFYENTVTNILNKTFGKENVKLITDEYGNTWNEIKIKPEHLNKIQLSRVLTNDILPLQGNEEIYKKYNLLNKEGKIKTINPNSESIKQWIKTNNNSPYYNFVIRQTPNGYKIFIKNKSYNSKVEGNSNAVGIEYLANITSKFKKQYNLDVILEPVFDDNNNPVKGKFVNNTVYLNPQYATVDTPLHEVIHPFVELIKQENPILYKNLIKELKESNIGKKIISAVSSNYSNSTNEEILDESLVTLMGYYSSGVVSSKEEGLLNIIKAFLKKIAAYIKSIFNKDINVTSIATTTTIADLSDIIVENNIDLSIVNIKNPKEAKLDLLSATDSNKLINTIGAKVVERIVEKPTKENLKPIIDSIIKQIEIENKTENVDASKIENLEERKAYKLKRNLISTALTLDENIDYITKSVTEDILKMHYSEDSTYSEEDDTVQNVNDEADIRDYEEGVENSGGWNNVDPEIRNFIYYNTYTYVDEAGYEITEAVDGLNVYKSIQTALADQSANDFINILEGLAKYDPQLKSVLDNFKVKTGTDTKGKKSLEQSNFYNKFFKTFENSKLEYIQIFSNKENEFIAVSANKSTSSGRLFNRWKNNFIVNKSSLKANAERLQKTLNNIGSEVITNPTEIVNSLYTGLNNLGLNVSKSYLEYSFVAESNFKVFEKQGVVKLDIDTLNKLLNSIKKDIDIFESNSKGNTTLLYKIAEADVIFRSDSIEDTYRDSRGKLRNSYTKQNLVTKAINNWKKNIQDTEFIKSIKEDKNNYYHYNYLFNNKLFNNETELQEVFKNADLALIGDIRLTEDKKDKKYTTRNITTSAFSKMQLALFRNSTGPKDIVDNSVFKFDTRTNSRQKFAFVDFGKISDKNTEIALRLPIDDRFYNNGFTDWFVEQLYNTVFLQEYNKLKNYDNKARLYYSIDKPLTINSSVISSNKKGNGWLNLSIFNNEVLDELNNPEYLELKNLVNVEDLSTKKELIKNYIKESFETSFKEYVDILKSEETIKKDSELTGLGNMYANNFLLRTSFQQLVKGDLAVSKNTDDDLKRNGRVTAYGNSGIDFTGEKSNSYKVLYMTEAIRYKIFEDNNFRNLTEQEEANRKANKPVEGLIEINSDDAGVRMTTKHFIDTLQRLGRLDNKTLEILNKVDNGDSLTKEEINQIDLIPLKGVHGGLDRYFKMSQLTLTKEFTSVKDKDGNWIPRLGREQLHNMRVLMENNSIGLAIPKSASKSISKTLFNQDNLFSSNEFDITENSEDVTWDDWRLQVENESGKTEISQPVQIIQMIDGSSKIPQNIKDELQELYKLQRTDDFNDALNIADGNTGFGKQALIDKFYDNAINSAADANTLEYLTGENGEFNYNPNLPHITFTFENYYTSHFNKSVLAQKIPGYKCTLAPATGIKILRNTQTGEIIRSDSYEANKAKFKSKEFQLSELRIHSKTSPYAECLMTKAQAGKLGINIGDSIDQDIFKMIGTRLPCQGYSSMIPLKVVDFLPEYYGSTIIAPEEIVHIAGSDYDVDSLFIMRKEAYLDNEGKTRYYTYNEKNDNLRWKDYFNYLTTKNKNIVSKIRTTKLDKTEVLKAFGYPSTKEEFLNKEKELGKLLNSKYAVTNRLVDIYEEILTNPDLLDDMQQPVTNSGFDIVGKTIYFDLQKQGSKINYFHNSDKSLKKHFELATQGKRDVGPAANGNSISSFFKKHKVSLSEDFHFSFDGKPVTNVYEDNVIDFDFIYSNNKPVLNELGLPITTDIKEVSKQEVHSGLMSITVDNQKDPVCFMLNLDPANVGIASTMIHLGIGGKGYVAALMNSDPVKTKINWKQYDPSYVDINSVTKESLIKSMMGKASPEENASIALLYETLQKISESTFSVSVLLATNKGIGSTFEDLDKIKAAEKNVKNDSVFNNINQAIVENKNIKFNLDAINTIDNNILSKEFLGRSEYMNNIREFLDKITYPDINLDKDFSGYLISNILKYNRNVDFNKLTELAIPNKKDSIVSKYFGLSIKYPEFKNNVLIKFLNVERGNNTKPDQLYFNQSIKLNGKSLEMLTDGYRELLQSDNTEVSEFAKDMFYYLIVKDNMKFTVNSFGKLLAPEVFKQISQELKIAVEAIIENDDLKLQSIIGKNITDITNEFTKTYLRWIGNADKYINYHPNKLKKSGIKSLRDADRNLILSFDTNKLENEPVFDSYFKGEYMFLDYPNFIKSGTSIYKLLESDGINAKYELINYIGLPIISPYHLDIETNEDLFNNRKNILPNVKSFSESDDIAPDINMIESMVGGSEAKKPEEYINDSEDFVSENDIFGIINEPSQLDFNEIVEDVESIPEIIIESFVNIKPSDSLNKAVDENIIQYFENFYYSLNNEQKGKLANIGIPKINTPNDLMKDFNKSKDQYNNNFNKYLEYIKNCRT